MNRTINKKFLQELNNAIKDYAPFVTRDIYVEPNEYEAIHEVKYIGYNAKSGDNGIYVCLVIKHLEAGDQYCGFMIFEEGYEKWSVYWEEAHVHWYNNFPNDLPFE